MSDNIVSVVPEQKIVEVLESPKIVSVSAPGPQGPPGPAGSSSGAVITFDTLGAPMNPWVITHNLGRLVNVAVTLDTGEEIYPGINQSNPNILTINFGIPTSGKALVE